MRVLGLIMPNGKKRFCDKRCHTSTNPHRSCICGGILRGHGEAYAKLVAPQAQFYANLVQGCTSPVWLHPALVRQREG